MIVLAGAFLTILILSSIIRTLYSYGIISGDGAVALCLLGSPVALVGGICFSKLFKWLVAQNNERTN